MTADDNGWLGHLVTFAVVFVVLRVVLWQAPWSQCLGTAVVLWLLMTLVAEWAGSGQ